MKRFPPAVVALFAACSVLMLVAACGGGGDGFSAPSSPSSANDVADPQRFQCIGRNAVSGAAVPAAEYNGVVNAFAVTSFDGFGNPYIVYSPAYYQLAPLFQSFTKRHECAHANWTSDEILANCSALQLMRSQGLTVQQEMDIQNWHLSMPVIGFQYGGSGSVFWQLTLNCAGRRF